MLALGSSIATLTMHACNTLDGVRCAEEEEAAAAAAAAAAEAPALRHINRVIL